LCAPLAQTLDQHARRGRDHEQHDRCRTRVRLPNLSGSRHFDIEHHMLPAAQYPLDLAAQRAVQLPRILGRLEELPRLTPPLELVPREEMIRLTVPLARPRLAWGGGHRVPDPVASPSPQLARDGGLAAPVRGGGYDHAWGVRHARL